MNTVKRFISKNKITAALSFFLLIITVLSAVYIFTEKHFIRPYVVFTVAADTVATKVFHREHDPLLACDRARIDKIDKKIKPMCELMLDVYYNQKATMTKEEKSRASDLKAADSNYIRFLTEFSQ